MSVYINYPISFLFLLKTNRLLSPLGHKRVFTYKYPSYAPLSLHKLTNPKPRLPPPLIYSKQTNTNKN